MSIFDDFDNWNIPTRSRSSGTAAIAQRHEQQQPITRQVFDAASRGNIIKVNTLLENNLHEDLHALINGLNAFHMVAKKGHIPLLERLLEYDPSLLYSRSHDQRDAFMFASFEGHIQVLRALHRHEKGNSGDVDDDAVDNQGNSSLHYAAWGGHIECVRFLIEECGKRSSATNHDHISPLQYAAAGNHTAVVEYLSTVSKASSDNDSISGMSPLHRAAAYGSYECLVSFIEHHGYDVNSKTQNGSTALHFAAQHGHREIVEYLSRTAAVDEENSYGLTPLQFACMGGHISIVSLLIQRGANPLKTNRSGENSLQIAVTSGNREICKFLNRIMAIDPFKKDRAGKTVVDKALDAGFKELANSLVQWSCINQKSEVLS